MEKSFEIFHNLLLVMNRMIAFSAMLTLLAVEISGQFTFSGRVLDESDQALTGANVVVLNTFLGAVTDTRGNFRFEQLKEGRYTVQVSFLGYEPAVAEITIDRNRFREFQLKRSAYLVEEVIVRSIRAGANDPVTMETIHRETLEKGNFARDIPFLLKQSPSFVSSSDAGHGVGYTGFRIRGTDANRINITVDGVPLNDAESHGVWWVNMPDFISSVENIQIQRGVGTSSNGGASFGASVNFKTSSRNNEPYAALNSSFGSYGTMRNALSMGSGLIDEKFSFDLRLSGVSSDGFIERAESDLQSMFFSGRYASDKNLIKFNMMMGREKTYQAWDGVPGYMLAKNRRYNGIGSYTDDSGNMHYYENETDNYRQDHYHLHFSREIAPSLWFNSTFHYTAGSGYYEQYKEDEYLPDYQLPEVAISDSVISETDLIRQKWLDNDFYGMIFSLNLRKQLLDLTIGGGANRYLGDHFGEVIWARHAGVSEIRHRWYENEGFKNDYHLFAKLNYSLPKGFYAYSDMQVRAIQYKIDGLDDDLRDISQTHDFLFFNPKVGINYRPDNLQRFYFSLAVANREPNRSNFVDADPAQPLPVHETLLNYEFGYSLQTSSFTSLLNFYFMDYNNQLVLTGEINDVGSPVMTNVKNSYRLGTELSAAWKINRFFQWEGNIAFSRNRIRNMVSFVDNWDYWNDPVNQDIQLQEQNGDTDIAFSPWVVAANQLGIFPLEGLEISLQTKFVGKQYIDNTSSENRKLDPWLVNDVMFYYNFPVKFDREFGISLLIANLFNHEYESNAWVYRYYADGAEQSMDGYFPQAGLHFLAGLKLEF